MVDSEENERKRQKIEVTESCSIDYSDKIFNNDLILNHIFKNLTAKEAKSISRVCKNWQNQCDQHVRQCSFSEDLFLVYGLSRYMRNREQRFSKILQLKDCESYDGLRDEIIKSLKNLRTVPSIALFFNSFCNSTQKHYSTFINSKKFLNLLPRSCSIMSISCSDTGMIGNLSDYKTAVETIQDHKFISGISYLFLPDLSWTGCQIIPFKGCQSELCRYLNEEQIIERNIKGVITFIKLNTSSSPDLTILKEIIGNQSNKVALGGIIIDYIDVSSNVDCKMNRTDHTKTMIKADFSALMFCGENVHCASLVIKEEDEDIIKQRLIDFKSNLHFNPDQSNTELIGFIFACAGRSYNIFNKLNLESDLIKEQFPFLKLYGIFGAGEIGKNYYGSYRSNKIRKDTVLHYYTTVLVLVQFIKS